MQIGIKILYKVRNATCTSSHIFLNPTMSVANIDQIMFQCGPSTYTLFGQEPYFWCRCLENNRVRNTILYHLQNSRKVENWFGQLSSVGNRSLHTGKWKGWPAHSIRSHWNLTYVPEHHCWNRGEVGRKRWRVLELHTLILLCSNTFQLFPYFTVWVLSFIFQFQRKKSLLNVIHDSISKEN